MAKHTLDTLQLPSGLLWIDEHEWQPWVKETEYSTNGALLIDAAPRQAGRPITLQAESDAGWISYATLRGLYALAAQPLATFKFTHADGRHFDVQFAGSEAISVQERIGRPEIPTDDCQYVITIRLIEV